MVATAQALEISPDQRVELESMAKSETLAHRQVRQARALLLAGDGVANEEIARRSEASTKTVRRWRARFAVDSVAGVGRIRPGRGRPTPATLSTANRARHRRTVLVDASDRRAISSFATPSPASSKARA